MAKVVSYYRALFAVAVAAACTAPRPSQQPRTERSVSPAKSAQRPILPAVATTPIVLEPKPVPRAPSLPPELQVDATHFWHSLPPPRGFKPIPAYSKEPFPGRPFARVVAVTHHYDWLETDQFKPGCEAYAVAKDGSFCPSVTYPPVTLSEAQVATLLDIVRRPDDPGRISVRCDNAPHHAFIFLNAKDLPVAQVEVDLDCGKWAARPIPKPLREVMGSKEQPLRELALELGMAHSEAAVVSPDSDSDQPRKPYAPAWANAGLSVPSGIDPSRTLAELTPQERRHACASALVQFYTFHPMFVRQFPGFGCEPRNYGIRELPFCIEFFPKCNVTVGAVEACQKALWADLCLDAEPTRAICAGLTDCLWSVMWLSARPAK